MHSQYFFTKNTVIITKIKSSIYIMSYKTFLHVHAFGNCRIPLTNSSGVMIKMTIDINTITKPRYITNISKNECCFVGDKNFLRNETINRLILVLLKFGCFFAISFIV